jgi:hypothetical protein
MDPTTVGYTGYRILRDGTPDFDPGFFDKLSFAFGISDLAEYRLVQALGALVVENELVRAWAHLYANAPGATAPDRRAVLDHILAARYAAGDDLAALRAVFEGRRGPIDGFVDRFDRWHDPAIAGALAVAQTGVHRFASYREAFTALRATRRDGADRQRYFVCHAIWAARAEDRSPQRIRDVTYVR